MQNSNRVAMIAYTQMRYDSRVKREALAAAEAGYQVDFFALQEKEPTVLEGVNLIYSKSKQFQGHSKLGFISNYLRFFIFCTVQLTKRHFKQRYQVIHINNMPNFLVFSSLICKWTGAKIILDIHDLVPELYAEKFQLKLTSFMIKLLYMEERLSANFAHVVLSTNRLHNKRFRTNGIKKKEFPIILNASDESIFTPFTEHNFYDEELRLIFPSTIAHRLGLDILVEAMELVARQKSNIVLQLFGDGEYREGLLQLIKEKGLEQTVKFLGLVDHHTLSEYYEKAHIGVIPWPSNFSTNYQMPIKINEYYTKGLGVIAADVKILKEYFSDCALFFEAGNPQSFADQILYLENNRDELARIATVGHKFYKANTWTRYKKEYQDIIADLIK